MKKKIIRIVAVALAVLALVLLAGSVYMLRFSLAPEDDRADTARCFRLQYGLYPEVREWADSLKRRHCLRDTFVVMPSGERHHAYYIRRNGCRKTALVLHGWRNCAVDMFFIARIYDREIGGFNVVMPDFHAHGLSEGHTIRMGWRDRQDMMHWLSVFQTDTMVVHGVSMGGATAMMMMGEPLPSGVKDIRFVDDCGYTDVWSEFARELKNQFSLPEFPMMHAASALCKLLYGWSFREASAIDVVKKASHPLLIIHGAADDFVPTAMAHRLFAAKPSPKRLWIAPKATHAEAYKSNKKEYIRQVKAFLEGKTTTDLTD